MKKTIGYIIADPTKNYTLLVDTPVPELERPFVAAQLMRAEPFVEQVGFLTASVDCDIGLRMAGGEFCGNAAMSAAAYYAKTNRIRKGTVHVRISGAESIVPTRLHVLGNDIFRCTVEMPRHRAIGLLTFDGTELPAVFFNGITHVIVEGGSVDRTSAETVACALCESTRSEAVGLMFCYASGQSMSPFVYVPSVKTAVWENSCASGTSAVGIYTAQRENKPVTLSIRQPGGTLSVSASPDSAPLLTGHVRFSGEKKTITLEYP